MPIYLDHHKPPQGMTPESVKMLVADIKAKKVTNGIRPVNGFVGKSDAWCLIEAPNPQAVHNLHEAVYKLNLGPGDVVEVQSLV